MADRTAGSIARWGAAVPRFSENTGGVLYKAYSLCDQAIKFFAGVACNRGVLDKALC